MASGFRDLDVVGRFARLRWPSEVSQPHWLLWPVWFRRIATPTSPDEKLGPFERAVLNCARAGITDAHHIGDLLLIDRRLIEVIQASLRDSGALAPSLALTADGAAALDSGAIRSAQVRTVYSFTCALSGTLLPRFTEQLYFADVQASDARLQIAHQDEGDDRYYPCFRLLPPDDSEPPVPLADDVIRAALRHARDRRGASTATESSGRNEVLPLAPQLNRVHIIDQRARPLFIATIVYRDPNPLSETSSIVVADPFGLGTTRKLRDVLNRLRATDPSTRDWIGRILRPAPGATELVDDPTQDWDLCASEAKTRLKLQDSPQAVLEQLTAIELALLHAGKAEITAAQRRRSLKQAGQASRDALEAGFMALADRFPFAAIRPIVEQLKPNVDDGLIKSMLRDACRNLGFDTHLPQRFFRVRVRDLQSVVLYEHFSKLAAVVATSLLVAKRHPTHPLRSIALSWPDFLVATETALEITGEAAHHQRGSAPDHGQIEELRDYTYECLRALLAPTGQHRD